MEDKVLPRIITLNSGESIAIPTNCHENFIFCRNSNSDGGFIGSVDIGATYYYTNSGISKEKITITPNKNNTYTISNDVGWKVQFIIL